MSKRLLTIASWLLALAPLVAVALLYGRLPAEVPMHWDGDGTVDYGDRVQLFVTAGLPPVLLVLFRFLPKIDPRKRNYGRFQGYYDGFCLVMMLFLGGMVALVLVESFHPGTVSMGKAVTTGAGVLMVFLGNLLPKVKNNFFMGVRTPWTLSDPDVWNRSNRLGGHCIFVYGLVLVAGGLFLPDAVSMALVLVGAAVIVIVPCLMSYFWYQKKQGEKHK